MEYFRHAWRQAQTHLQLKNNHVLVIGRSRGSELALLLGATFSEVCGVAAFSPGHVSWSVFSSERRDGQPLASWTYEGLPIPYAVMNADFFDQHLASVPTAEPVCLSPWFKRCLQYAPCEAEIAVERINGPILLLSGTDDQLWPATEAANAIEKRLRKHAFRHAVTSMKFSNAGHCFDLPTGSFLEDDRFFQIDGRRFCFGGSESGTLEAQSLGWSKLIEFCNAAKCL